MLNFMDRGTPMQLKLMMMAGIAIVVMALVSGLLFYKMKYTESLVDIATLTANVETLKSANKSLKMAAEKVKAEMDNYIEAMNKMGEANTEINAKLQESKNKLARHKMTKLRNSRHSELVLKILNRSIDKSHKRYTEVK